VNKYDALTRSQILIAINACEIEILRVPRNSKAYTRLHTKLSQLFLALHRKTDQLLKVWRDVPDN